MKHKVINEWTGEVVGSDHIPSLVSVVKGWVNRYPVTHHDIKVLTMSRQVRDYLNQVAFDRTLTTCDVCDRFTENRHMHWHEDNEGVVLFGECEWCRNEPYEILECPEDDDILFDDDDLDLDDDDVDFFDDDDSLEDESWD